MTAKFHMKVRGIEIDWEGDVAFLKDDMPALVQGVMDAIKSAGFHEQETEEEVRAGEGAGAASNGRTFTTKDLAAKTSPKSAGALFITALAKLQISDGKDHAARGEIHAEMKKVSSVYKETMFNNLSMTIKRLMDNGSINEPSTGDYALSPAVYGDMKSKAK